MFSTFGARFHCKDVVTFRCGLHSCTFPGMQGLFNILMSLHFVRISDAKVIASRFPATVLNVRNDGFASKILNEEKTGLNTVVYAKE